MRFSELPAYKKQLVRAGYYKLNKRVLDDNHAESLLPDQMNFYISVREQALKREELWSTVKGWGIGIAVLTFFGFLLFNPGNKSDSSSDDSRSYSERLQDDTSNSENTEPIDISSPTDVAVDPPEYDSESTSPAVNEYNTSDQSSGCNPNYTGCIPDVSYDLDCADIGRTVNVIGYDEYNLDRDGDGYGCESY